MELTNILKSVYVEVDIAMVFYGTFYDIVFKLFSGEVTSRLKCDLLIPKMCTAF